MRISDWSSDVCSSDLRTRALTTPPLVGQRQPRRGGRRSSPSLPSRGEDRPGPSKYQTPSSAKRGDGRPFPIAARRTAAQGTDHGLFQILRSAEHTSDFQSLMRTSYSVYCLKKKYTT